MRVAPRSAPVPGRSNVRTAAGGKFLARTRITLLWPGTATLRRLPDSNFGVRVQSASADRCPLSPRERARVRGNGITLLALLFFLAAAFTGFAENLPIAITDPAEAQAEGRAIVQEILSARPETSGALTGWFNIRTAAGARIRMPVKFETAITATNWTTVYETSASTNDPVSRRLAIEHSPGSPNRYDLEFDDQRAAPGAETMYPFARSDFWLADLGLEFFHWPEQRVIRKEIRRSRSCKVLESVNPQPATNAYSKVISWIDRESHGIVQAEAYDAGGKLLKEFAPKSFKKVNGQWLLQEMEIRNVQTGSRTRLEFDLAAE